MVVDCDTCQVRGGACSDCVVPVILGLPGRRGDGAPGGRFALAAGEAGALGVLAGAGLVPPLRLLTRAYHGPGAGSPRPPRAADTGRPR